MNKTISTSVKLSVAGLTTALSTVILIFSSVIAVGTYALPIIAGTLLCVLVIDFNKALAWSSFVATSLIAIIISSDKEAVLYYICFFGFYPIIKANLENIKNKIISYVLKFATFNICMIALYFIAINLFNIPLESFTIFNLNIPLLFLIFGNIFFIIYDIALTRVISLYISKYRKYVIRKNK